MALPVEYDTVNVRGKYVYLDGTPVSGTVKFTGKVLATSVTRTVIVPSTITATLDPDGSFSINVPATDDPDILPNGWTYSVEEKFNHGGGRKFDIDVPLLAKEFGLDIADVAPVTPQSGDPTAFVTLSTHIAMSNDVDTALANSQTAVATANSAATTANNAATTANGIAGTANTALANSSTALTAVTNLSKNVFNVLVYGALGNGSADDTTAIQNAINAAVANGGGTVLFAQGLTYKITHKIDFPIGRVSYKGNAVTLDCSAVPDTDGFAVRFIPDTDILNYVNWCEGLRILGPRSEARNLDGVFVGLPVGGGSGNVSGYSFRNITVDGFRDNWVLGNQSWVNGYYQCSSRQAWRRGYNFDGDVNAGENYNLHGGVVADCENAAGDAVGLYASQVGACDIHCFGMSFDYDDIEIDVRSGTLSLHGCHLENRSSQPMIKASWTGGSEHTTISLLGCQIGPTETTTRPYYVELTGDHVYFNSFGCKWSTFNRGGAEIVKVISGGPSVRFVGGDVVTGGGSTLPILNKEMNMIQNGDFESGSLVGWTTSGTAVTFTVQNTMLYGGSWALKIAGIGTAGACNVVQKIPVRPGELLFIGARIASDSMTAGSVNIGYTWRTKDDTVISSGTFASITTNQGWTFMGGRRTAPKGAAYGQVEIPTNNLNGNVYVDEVLVIAI